MVVSVQPHEAAADNQLSQAAYPRLEGALQGSQFIHDV